MSKDGSRFYDFILTEHTAACDYCKQQESSCNCEDYHFCDKLNESGWEVTRSGRLRCPVCVKKIKKKKK